MLLHKTFCTCNECVVKPGNVYRKFMDLPGHVDSVCLCVCVCRETKDNFLGTVQQALDKVPLAEAFVLPWFKGGRYIC